MAFALSSFRISSQLLAATGIAFAAFAYACSSEEAAAPDPKGAASNCDSRCTAYLDTCADSNVSCDEICAEDFDLTEGELSCLEGANCKEVDSKKKDCVAEREAKVNGVLASKYFAKFTYETINTYMNGAADMPAQASGNDLVVMGLYLNEDNTFILYYREGSGQVTPEGDDPYFVNFTQDGVRVEGDWAIEKGELKLGEYATCVGAKDAFDKDALSCTMDKSLVSKAAIGKEAILQIAEESVEPDDNDAWKDYAAPYEKPDSGVDSGASTDAGADDAASP